MLFADDAKISKEIRTPEDVNALQRDMERIQEWSNKWLLVFNDEKCSTMHIGKNNLKADYILNGKPLKKTEVEKDLGVLVSNDLKPSKHVAEVAAHPGSERLSHARGKFMNACLSLHKH